MTWFGSRRRGLREPTSLGPVIGVCSLGKTRGCTTLAVVAAALAETESTAHAYVVEFDPAGGDLNAWWGLGAARAGAALTGHLKAGSDLGDALRATAAGGGALPVVSIGSDGGTTVESLKRVWVARGDNAEITVVVDAGRWHSRQLTMDRVSVVDTLIALVDPSVGGIDRARRTLKGLRDHVNEVIVAQIGSRPYGPTAVSEELGVDVTALRLNEQTTQKVMEGSSSLRLTRTPAAADLRKMLWPVAPDPDAAPDKALRNRSRSERRGQRAGSERAAGGVSQRQSR